jgi:hypothetical protein
MRTQYTVRHSTGPTFLCRLFGHWMKWWNFNGKMNWRGECRLCRIVLQEDFEWPVVSRVGE